MSIKNANKKDAMLKYHWLLK